MLRARIKLAATGLTFAIVCCGNSLMAQAPSAVPAAEQEAKESNTIRASLTEAGLDVGLSARQREMLYASLAADVERIEKQGNIIKTVVRLVGPTVVHIEAEKREPDSRGYGRGSRVEETGSGVVINWNGKPFVVTNRHVIRDAELANIKISCSDGRTFHPMQVWMDADTDVAVMSTDEKELVGAKLGDSDDMEIGDFVLAVGSPFGLAHSVTYGIISAKGRRDLELGDGGVRYQDFMQTDASINPGNSGGPLFNLRGEVVGINTAIATNSGRNEGIGFSIPINMVMVIARQLIETGAVKRAFLGVTLDARFTPSAAAELGLPRRMGARIVKVNPGSPAESSHLQVGDVIVKFNGIAVDDDTHLVNIISGFTEAGADVPVVVYRDRQSVPMQVKVGISEAAATSAATPAK